LLALEATTKPLCRAVIPAEEINMQPADIKGIVVACSGITGRPLGHVAVVLGLVI